MERSALLLCTTYHQLLMGQALHRQLRPDYAHFQLVWHGDRPLTHLRPLLLDDLAGSVLDCAGFRRVKAWRAEGAGEVARAAAAVREILARFPPGALDLFTGNDNQGFFRVALEESGRTWDDVVLFEEGIGFYLGTRRYLEKTAVNLRLLARPGFRLRYRDFSRNPAIRRFACNHPGLLRRRGVQILDTSAAYRGVVDALVAGRKRDPDREPVEALYVSGNFSEASHLSFEAECRMVEHLADAIRRHSGAGRIHVKFHPLDSAPKRARLLALGLVDLEVEEPLELECLRRPPANLYSFRSSVLLNIALLDQVATRIWIVRGAGGGYDRLAAPAAAPLFSHLVESDLRFAYFDPARALGYRRAV